MRPNALALHNPLHRRIMFRPRHLHVAAFLAVSSFSIGVAHAQTRVQILHASDLEGGVSAIDAAPNFAAIVEALQADAATQSIPSLLLSAGDNYIPGPFFNAAADPAMRPVFQSVLANPFAREGVGRVDISIMNLLGFDASAVGNHEFDAGPAVYRSIVGTDIVGTQPRWLGADFPYLSANLDFTGEPSLASLYTANSLPSDAFFSPIGDLVAAAAAKKFAPATIVEKDGEFFGIVGATTPIVETISSTGGVDVKGPGAGTNDMVALASILQPVIDALTAQGIDKIILVTHLQQLVLEETLVPLLFDVDIAIAGGSDTLLADGSDVLLPGDVAAGPYPIVTANAGGQTALIVSTDGEYSYVGRLVVDFDANGVVLAGSVDPVVSGPLATNDNGVLAFYPDLVAPFQPGTAAAKVRELTDAVSDIVIAKDSVVLGKASVFLEGRREVVRTEETNLGNLTADANLAIARLVDPRVRVSIKNAGGIRAEIGSIDGITGELLPTAANPQSGKLAGEVSQLDVENSLRFNNNLALLTLTRAQLKQVLEHAVAAWTPTSTPGQFGQLGGVAFSFDPSLPAGQRVRTAGFIEAGGGLPLFVFEGAVVGGPAVRVVTLGFLADGGDAYPFSQFIAANRVFANRVDLVSAGLGAGLSTFAAPGSEQDALAEFLLANHTVVPFSDPETDPVVDARIQNLSLRIDTVIDEVRKALFMP